ncbi:MAG: hypothetical protein M1409_06190 [Actinobacteria bacterium]|nr:hypothetical protein [Actinomycetota bacterium]
MFNNHKLKRIRRSQYSAKDKGFDMTGIVPGSVFIVIVLWFVLGEILVPH